MLITTLDTIPQHQQVRLLRYTQPMGPFRHKLLAMGLTPGVLITVVRIAPLGDPIQVLVRGCTLSLRKVDCQQIEVAPLMEPAIERAPC